ncbi:MAG: WG repeat-containing protein [Bacteroidia bacterium]
MNRIIRNITVGLIALGAFLGGQAQMLPVKNGRLWGLIMPDGRRVTEPIYDAIPVVLPRQAVVVLGGKYGVIDTNGRQLIEPKYTFVRCLSENTVLINQGGDCQGRDCEGGLWGFVNLALDRRIDPTFQLIGSFEKMGLAKVNLGGKCGYETCSGGKWGLIDSNATLVLAPEYQQIGATNLSEVYFRGEKGWGLYNWQTRTMVIPAEYDSLDRVTPLHVAFRRGTQWGVLDNQGKELAPPTADAIKGAGLNYLAYRVGNLFGLMDSTGRIMSKPLHSSIRMNPNSWVTYTDVAQMGLADTSDRAITRDFLTQVVHFGKGFCLVGSGVTFGAVNRAGEQFIPIQYEGCRMANDSLILTWQGNRLMWHDLTGKTLKGMDFEELGKFRDNKVTEAKFRGKWGVINMEGDWIMEPKYEEARIYLHSAKGRLGEDWSFAYFDDQGHTSKVKRIVIIKGDDQEEDPLGLNGTGTTGWFSTSRNLWGLRSISSNQILIEPTYPKIELIPNAKVTLVFGKVRNSEEHAWGLVDHTNGKQLVEPLFEKVYSEDFRRSDFARVIYAGSGKYALLSQKGQLVSLNNASFIGTFCDSVARVNIGGVLEWSTNVGFDTITSDATKDKYSNEIKMNYQYCRGGKWGYIDAEGKWLKPAEYQGALDFQDGLARVKVDGKWGAVDKRFNMVIKPEFDFIERMKVGSGKVLFAIGRDRTAYGFMDGKGEIRIEPQFQEVGRYREGLVKFKEAGKWGFANLAGEVVIPAQYGMVGDFHDGRARVRNNRAWGFIDTLGSAITPQKYLRAGDYHDGRAWVQTEKFFGFLDLEGNMAIAPEFSAVGDFSEGLAPAKRKGVYGLINLSGNWVVQPNYFRIGSFRDSVAVVQEKGQYGLITPEGSLLVKPNYREIADFSEGLVRFRRGMGYGFMDASGNVRVDDQYSNAKDFSCGRAAIFVQGKWGFIDSAGREIVPPKYSKVHSFKEGRAAVCMGNVWGFIDLSGNVVVPLSYSMVTDFQDARAAVFLTGKGWGFVNLGGTQVIDCEYDAVGFRQPGIISVQKGSKWGLISTFGAVMTPCKYDAIGEYSQGMATVMLRRSIGVVDGTGKVLLPPEFDTVKLVGNVIQVEDNNAVGYMTPNGEWLWAPSK